MKSHGLVKELWGFRGLSIIIIDRLPREAVSHKNPDTATIHVLTNDPCGTP
jgi:hypothetical protein